MSATSVEDEPFFNLASEVPRDLTEEEKLQLADQDSRRVTPFRASKFSAESNRHWDKFYKRNTTKFFKDRHWTLREFQELASNLRSNRDSKALLKLTEIGCGVGNFVYPLLEELDSIFVYACDFSPRAVQFVKEHQLYDESKIKAFVVDITQQQQSESNPNWQEMEGSIDICSCVFVLSALSPTNFSVALNNIRSLLRPGGLVLFRDYAINDMAMIRFGKGTKINENYYLRQDGTTSYFFELNEARDLFRDAGFVEKQLCYVHRKTVNRKEGVDAQRVFVQGVYVKQ